MRYLKGHKSLPVTGDTLADSCKVESASCYASSRGFRGPKHCDECASVRADADYVISDRNGRREREREREREKMPIRNNRK